MTTIRESLRPEELADLTTAKLNGITGPYTSEPSGKFGSDDKPIMRACEPYWVVRYVGGHPYSILRDRQFKSVADANEFAALIGK